MKNHRRFVLFFLIVAIIMMLSADSWARGRGRHFEGRDRVSINKVSNQRSLPKIRSKIVKRVNHVKTVKYGWSRRHHKHISHLHQHHHHHVYGWSGCDCPHCHETESVVLGAIHIDL